MASRSNSDNPAPGQTAASTKAAPKSTTRTTTRKPAAADAAPKAAAKAPSPRKKSVPMGAGSDAVELSAEDRQRYVSEAAYFIAERRGFSAGSDVEDWLQAESEIDQLLAAGTTRH